jgi:hypothetical protein
MRLIDFRFANEDLDGGEGEDFLAGAPGVVEVVEEEPTAWFEIIDLSEEFGRLGLVRKPLVHRFLHTLGQPVTSVKSVDASRIEIVFTLNNLHHCLDLHDRTFLNNVQGST